MDRIIRLNSRIRKCNAKMISILKRSGLNAWAKQLRKENKRLT